MPNIGNIGEYDDSEEWVDYVSRIKLYFKANGVKDEIQVAVFFYYGRAESVGAH